MSHPEQKSPEETIGNSNVAYDASTLSEHLVGLPGVLEASLNSDIRDRVIHYLETLLARVAPERSPFHVSRERLASTHAFTEAELAQLTPDDLSEMSDRLQAHYREDWYPEEIVFHAQAMLDEKAKSPTE